MPGRADLIDLPVQAFSALAATFLPETATRPPGGPLLQRHAGSLFP